MPNAAAKQIRFWIAWLPLVVFPAVAAVATWQGVPRWATMWLISVIIYYSVKWLTWQMMPRPHSSWLRITGWWIAWPGMDPSRFLSMQSVPEQKPHPNDWWRGVLMIAIGCTLIGAALVAMNRGWLFGGAWLGMFGIVCLLHFGAFQILSWLWRCAGADARPIMNRPLASRSVAEFWGRRWNLAFRDAAHAAVFRPVARRFGASWAVFMVFIFSGIIHEMAISIPAQGGYGLPTLYFLWQWVAVMFEKSPAARNIKLSGGLPGRAYTLINVFAPVPVLFHPMFIGRVMVPMFQIVAAAH